MSEPKLTVTQSGPDAPVDPTPSQTLINAAKSEAVITDGKGRSIVLKRPGVLGQYRLIEMLGDTASNAVYVNMVLPLIYVASIDGDPCSCGSKRELEALIQRLDEEGIAAVMDGVSKNFGKADPESDKAALKN